MNLSRHMATLAKRTNRRPLLLMLLMLAGEVSQATERVQRRFDSTTGLAVSTIFSLAQDAEGFIWIGTAGGVVRYDGNQMRPWAKDIINREVFTLAVSSVGEVLVAEGSGKLYRITTNGVEAVIGPEGGTFDKTYYATFDGSNRLWVVSVGGIVHVRESENTWRQLDTATFFPGERVHRVVPASGDRVYFLTAKAVWESRAGDRPTKILSVMRPLRIVEHPNGSVFVLAWQIDGEIIELRDGHSTNRVTLPARPMGMTLRGGVVWASFDRYLVSLRGDEPPEVIGPEQDLPSGGPLLVDHEGSMWLGTFTGLIQYPEPETRIWNQKDGLPSAHTRSIAQTEEGIWVTTWQGIGRLMRVEKAWRAIHEKVQSNAPPCIENGNLMFNEGSGVVERRDGRFVTRPGTAPFHQCVRTSDGSLLFTTPKGLFRDYGDGRPAQALGTPPIDDREQSFLGEIFEDASQRLWTAVDDRVCHAPTSAVLSGQLSSWTCQTIDDSPYAFDFVQLPSGNLWMSTNRAGVWRWRSDHWERIPVSRNLASQAVHTLTLSPSGGIWLVGNGVTMRVVERSDFADGWEVVEVLSAWEGLPGSDTTDLIEQSDGYIWLSTTAGVVRVSAEARHAEAAPPKVRLVDVVINGRSASTDVKAAELAFGSQVELHFAALSYRDRSRLRYQYRLRSNAPWIDSRDAAPVLRFVDLSAGDYQAEVRASLDGVNWTAAPARLSFQVLNPWYLRPITLLLFAIVAAAVLYAIYRARVRAMMRLERQRAQIARDLHDEMGSGLGSIGILSGLAAENNLEGIEHQELAKKISETAGELGTTLTEIVWTLKPGAGTLEALAYHLAERGGRLFPANEPSFTTQFPASWPKVELSLAVRRNVLLIASEALHNAARHSQAKEVTLGLEPAGGKRWKLWLNDDGCGLSNDNSSNGSGMGLQNMRRRAEEISAAFSLSSNNGKGTSLSLVFDPKADDRRLE